MFYSNPIKQIMKYIDMQLTRVYPEKMVAYGLKFITLKKKKRIMRISAM